MRCFLAGRAFRWELWAAVLLMQLCWGVQPNHADKRDWQQLDTSDFFVPKLARTRSIVYYGSNERLRFKLHQLRNGQNLTVAAVGGSITGGVYAEGMDKIWVTRMMKHLEQVRKPDYGHFHLANGAVPGTISQFMSTCVRVHVPESADIVVIEYAMNDPWDGIGMEHDYRKAFERLIRKLLQYPRHPAVVLVDAYSYRAARGRYWASSESAYLELATFYNLPLVSVKAGCFHLMRSGRVGWLVNSTVDAEVRSGRWPKMTFPPNDLYFFYDDIHPTSKFGHRAMGELGYELFERTLRDLDVHPFTQEEARRANPKKIFAPMIEGNHASLSDKCFLGHRLKDTMSSSDGFEWINESKTAFPKWGYVGREAGNRIAFKMDTQAGSGRREQLVQVEVAHLKSYENMGKVEVACSNGCNCDKTVIDGHHELKNSQTFLQAMMVSQAPECVLTFTISHDSSSGKHKFKVIGITVSDQSGEIQTGNVGGNVGAVEYVHNIAARSGKEGRFDLTNHI